jgi:ATP-binding cassette, subfamily B, multidrug efflux pump
MPRRMNNDFRKPKNFKKSFKELLSTLKPYIFPVIIAIIFAILSSILTLVGPNQIKEITNIISKSIMTRSNIDIQEITNKSIFLIILFVLGAFFNFFQGFIVTTITQIISKNLRSRISNKINKLPLKYLDSHPFGDTLSRITNDVDTMSQSLNTFISSFFSAITLFLGAIIMMFSTNYIMALSAIASTIFGFVMIALILSKSQKYFIMQQKQLGIINSHIEEVYSGHNVVKSCGAEKECKDKFNIINDDLYNSAWKSQFLSGLMGPLMSFIGNFGYVVVCIVGASLVINMGMEIGVIVAFMIYIRLFMQPLSTFAQILSSLQSSVASSERIFEFLDEKELDDESNKKLLPLIVKGNVDFKDVVFGYDENKIIIKDFNANLKAGEKVAIVGPTGAGKTTIVNLLMRFYEVNSGDILIDGISIKDLKREQVHNIFGMVLQDTWTFDGSIKDNIIFNNKNITDEQVENACKVCGIDHFIKTLPNGYDTILDENTTLSVGQKQLITIARAMIQNSPMLILDEATSSVDTRTEVLIQNAMDNLTKNRTSFVIAHRLSTIKNASLILVIKDGNIVEQGTHEELLQKNGSYAELYNSQFSD